MRREKGRATEIRMDERMQRKKGKGNCGSKRERLSLRAVNKGKKDRKKRKREYKYPVKG